MVAGEEEESNYMWYGDQLRATCRADWNADLKFAKNNARPPAVTRATV